MNSSRDISRSAFLNSWSFFGVFFSKSFSQDSIQTFSGIYSHSFFQNFPTEPGLLRVVPGISSRVSPWISEGVFNRVSSWALPGIYSIGSRGVAFGDPNKILPKFLRGFLLVVFWISCTQDFCELFWDFFQEPGISWSFSPDFSRICSGKFSQRYPAFLPEFSHIFPHPCPPQDYSLQFSWVLLFFSRIVCTKFLSLFLQ